ncbi:hypothetical protein [Virgisporangium aurantiacum]|uniref:Uncharacterized protein n=1 Tax=Virgisporangium aurantiacum TaxID=175570 RepID=A0A8J4E3Z9_9ACTN|nr:hypothetical protein [Virgisporangium aurantiacum]GIJ60478.1 hypothetical protein Vau01_079940 [Virgisporangium aurantiacum]
MRSIPYLAATWCLGYAALALSWVLGAPVFPFGADDPRGADMGSWWSGATPGWTGALFAVACAAGAVAALAAARGQRVAAVVLIPLAVVLALVVPDVRVLQNLAYSFGGYFGLVDWPVLNQVLCLAGGALLALTAVLLLRRPPCPECLRPAAEPGRRERWLRIGRWAVVAAIVAQLPYGVQRAAWNFGIPLGVSQQFVDELAADIDRKGMPQAAMWILVGPDVLGALLTLGLVMAWGERLPAWVPFLGGRRVPISLAVVPATVVSIAVTVAGLAIYRFALDKGGVSGAGVPGLLWVPWGVALATATVAYVMRRRRTCDGACEGRGARPGEGRGARPCAAPAVTV